MIIALDTETQGLTKKIILGCIIKENGVTKIYKTKEEIWKEIQRIAKAEAKRKKNTHLYAHNAEFDFIRILDLKDPNLSIYSSKRPFIWAYKIPGTRQRIKLLDTKNIYNETLAEIGDMLGLPKGQLHPKLKKDEPQKYTKEEIQEISEYCKRDTEIVLEAIKTIKQSLLEEDIKLKNIITVSQVAINYVQAKLRRQPKEYTEDLIWNQKTGEYHRGYRYEEIHQALRGGAVRAYQIGSFQKATEVDINGLYADVLRKMPIPRLRTERKHYQPTKTMLKKIGLSLAMIKNESDELGILPIRTKNGNHTLQKGQTGIAVWTNAEITYALKHGHKLIKQSWTITYETSKYNPYKSIVDETYRKRQEAKTPTKKKFYKLILNASIGKLAENRPREEIIIRSVEEQDAMKKKGYEIVGASDTSYIYRKITTEKRHKTYYCPIIITLVTAWARIKLNEATRKIPKNDRLYSDTDSIFYKGDHIKKFNIGKELGQWKIVKRPKTPMTIYAKKTYQFGDEYVLSGVTAGGTIENEKITHRKMIGIKGAKNLEEVGKFKEQISDLIEIREEYLRKQEELEEATLHIDKTIKEIDEFLP